MAIARLITLNMLRQEKTCKKGIEVKRFKAALDKGYVENSYLLFFDCLCFHHRNINLFETEVNMVVRIGILPDSSMLATQVGEIRIVTCANQQVLDEHDTLVSPHDFNKFFLIFHHQD